MNIISEIKKAVLAKYQTTTLYTVDAIPFYMDHVPNSRTFPFICFFHIDANNTMAMPSAAQPGGFDYVDSRFQFSVFANDRQHVQMEDICDRLEDAFHRQALVTGNGVTHIATITTNSRTKFWDEKQKIWHISQDYRILAGR